MSYDIDLVDANGHPVNVRERHTEGGTYRIGSITKASLNVTYNYCQMFRDYFHEDGIWWLYGKTGAECIKPLEAAVAKLGTKRDDDYRRATPGNAGHALMVLLEWAREHPEAVFQGD